MPPWRVRPLSLVMIAGITAGKQNLGMELSDLVEASPVRDIVYEEHGVVSCLGEDVLSHLCGLQSRVIDYLHQVSVGSVRALGTWLWPGWFKLAVEGW